MLAFIHIPKTGGQTISKSLLRSAFGIRHCDVLPWAGENGATPITAEDLERAFRLHPRLESMAGHSLRLQVDYGPAGSSWQYFAFVRRPLEQCISHYLFKIALGETAQGFEEWLQDEALHNPQTKTLAGCEEAGQALGLIEAKGAFVGLTERFDEALVIFKRSFAPHLEIAYERKNTNRDREAAAALRSSPRVQALVAEACRADLQLYEAVAGELYPRWRQGCGPGLDEAVAALRKTAGRVRRGRIAANRLYRNLVYKPALRLYALRHAESARPGASPLTCRPGRR